MTKGELAEKARISSVSVVKLGKGSNITTDASLRVCEALNCDISEIVETVNDDGTLFKDSFK